jgi:hypothetical protein
MEDRFDEIDVELVDIDVAFVAMLLEFDTIAEPLAEADIVLSAIADVCDDVNVCRLSTSACNWTISVMISFIETCNPSTVTLRVSELSV